MFNRKEYMKQYKSKNKDKLNKHRKNKEIENGIRYDQIIHICPNCNKKFKISKGSLKLRKYKNNFCPKCYNENFHKLDNKEVRRRIKSKHVELIGSVNGVMEKAKFKCFCGNIFEVRLSSVLLGNTSSCGCIRKRTKDKHKNWKGIGEIPKNYFNTIFHGAKRRGLKFNITLGYMWNLFLKQDRKCALSGIELKFNQTKGEIKNQTASLDRINSKKGYIEGNVQWVHKDVNQMKMDLREDYFKYLCKKISNYKGSK